jgi:hypothetical protein
MKNTIITLLIFTALLISCKTPEPVLHPTLRTRAMEVKGRHGWQINQVVKYGDFYTDKVKRGWTHSYDVPFFIRFSGASEKLSFTQFDSNMNSVKVACIGKLRSRELDILGDYFRIPLKFEHYFAGSAVIHEHQKAYDFVIFNPSGDFLREKASAGFVTDGSTRIEIEAIRRLKGQPKWMEELTIYGYEFFKDGKSIGAVSTINKGRVWLVKDLSEELKLILAAVSTGILLRRDIEDLQN